MIIAALEEINMSIDATTDATTDVSATSATASDTFSYNPDFEEMNGPNLDTKVEITPMVHYQVPALSELDTVAVMMAEIEASLPTLRRFPTVEEIERALQVRERAQEIQQINSTAVLTSQPEDALVIKNPPVAPVPAPEVLTIDEA